jgi:hypothetical protein
MANIRLSRRDNKDQMIRPLVTYKLSNELLRDHDSVSRSGVTECRETLSLSYYFSVSSTRRCHMQKNNDLLCKRTTLRL